MAPPCRQVVGTGHPPSLGALEALAVLSWLSRSAGCLMNEMSALGRTSRLCGVVRLQVRPGPADASQTLTRGRPVRPEPETCHSEPSVRPGPLTQDQRPAGETRTRDQLVRPEPETGRSDPDYRPVIGPPRRRIRQ